MASRNPGSITELSAFMQKLYENKNHVKSIKVDTSQKVIAVDLDFAANLAGHADFTVPLLGSRVMEAKDIVRKIWADADRGLPPSESAITSLWECLDHKHP